VEHCGRVNVDGQCAREELAKGTCRKFIFIYMDIIKLSNDWMFRYFSRKTDHDTIRIGKPFFRSERARTRPEGPAPTSKDHQLDRVSPSCCKAYNAYRLHVSFYVKELDVDELELF
jgi:hypothetical protein